MYFDRVFLGYMLYKMYVNIYICFCRICLVVYFDFQIFIFIFICMIFVDIDYYVFFGDMLFYLMCQGLKIDFIMCIGSW